MVEVDTKDLAFKWGKQRGVGGKDKKVRFFQSFSYGSVEYALYDCVYLYGEGETEPYIGKLIKIWENPDKTKKVKVLWFFRPREIQYYVGVEDTAKDELFLASGEGAGLANVNPLVMFYHFVGLYIIHLLLSRCSFNVAGFLNI